MYNEVSSMHDQLYESVQKALEKAPTSAAHRTPIWRECCWKKNCPVVDAYNHDHCNSYSSGKVQTLSRNVAGWANKETVPWKYQQMKRTVLERQSC